jgi:hypothetical protein
MPETERLGQPVRRGEQMIDDEREEMGPDGKTQSGETLPGWPRRLILILTEPVTLFQRLRESPRALVALLLGGLLVALSNLAIPGEIWEEVVRDQLIAADQDLPDNMGMAGRVGQVAAVFGAFIAWPIMGLVTAGVYALLFRFGLGYSGNFRQYLSVTAYALLIPAMAALVVAPLRILVRDPQFSLNLAVLLPVGTEGFVPTFLGFLDLFNLWAYVLIGTGAAVMAGQERITSSVVVSVGFALVMSALVAAVVF